MDIAKYKEEFELSGLDKSEWRSYYQERSEADNKRILEEKKVMMELKEKETIISLMLKKAEQEENLSKES